MKSRVNFTPPHYIGYTTNWRKLVEKPLKEGNIIEAFGSADAIIDSQIETCLRVIYHEHKCQDLINEIHLQRSRVNFYGLIILGILKSKSIIDEKFYQRVLNFKKARNLVLHNVPAEYSLVIGNPKFNYNSQEELDLFVEKETKKWITEAFEIFKEIVEIIKKTDDKKDYYFSNEFYKKNPRGNLLKRKFPSKK